MDGLELFEVDGELPKQLPSGENEKLVERYQAGEVAVLDKLIRHNIRLVVKCAYKHKGSVHYEDLIQAGLIGLIRAVQLFDSSKGAKFSSYAYFWIRQGVGREVLSHSQCLHIPDTKHHAVRKMHQRRWDLATELGHLPTEAELAVDLAISVEELRELQATEVEVLSYNVQTGEDDTELGDLLQGSYEDADVPAFVDVHKMLQGVLTPREYQILCSRWGLAGEGQKSTRQLANQQHGSPQVVSALEKSAFQKLSHPAVVLKLVPGGF